MRTVHVCVSAPGAAGIPLGRRGENGAARIMFDVSGLAETYGDGAAVLMAKRPADEAAYPVPTERDGNTVTWTVTNADTAYRGAGKCELFWYVGDVLAKSVVFGTSISRDIGETAEEPPEPWQGWVDEVLEASQNAAESAESASESALAAAASAASITGTTFADSGDGNITITEVAP